MKTFKHCLLSVVVAALATCGAAAYAAYPERPITLIVPFPPGGGTDLSARLIVPYIEKYMGGNAKIVVINKGGAGGDIGAAEIARSKADGYTIGFMNVPKGERHRAAARLHGSHRVWAYLKASDSELAETWKRTPWVQ